MGLNVRGWSFLQRIVNESGKAIKSSKICLLGNLYLQRGTEAIQLRYGTHILQKCFERDGAVVVSIDINGKDGALPFDLQRPLPTSLGQFDIIIDGGTSEHVLNRDACFRNIKNICKIDGLMFHMVPHIGSWLGHCIHHYDELFFLELARKYHYSVVDMYIDDYVGADKRLVFACLRKEYDG